MRLSRLGCAGCFQITGLFKPNKRARSPLGGRATLFLPLQAAILVIHELLDFFRTLAPPRRYAQRVAMPVSHPAAAPAGLIDVKQLMAELTNEELLASADAYFAGMTLASEQCWKPFSNPADASHLSRHLGLVLEAAQLFPGARVLDFGCGTGWLTLALAQMGCAATGVDISPAAIGLAEALALRERRPGGVTPAFLVYDGTRLPLPADSVDRIVCCDAFHHLRDPGAMLQEFARVLTMGGIAAFMEPGPNHSKTAQSQAEMRNFKVIENDICLREITAHALAAGLDEPRMLVQFQRPMQVSSGEFLRWADAGMPPPQRKKMVDQLVGQLTDGQCFFMHKGAPLSDSRQPEGLAAKLALSAARRVAHGAEMAIQLELTSTNTGQRSWIAAAGPGQVNVGVQVVAADGSVELNFARLHLPPRPVLPGETVVVSGTIPLPASEPFTLRLEMVAEHVAWFGDLGDTQRLTLSSRELR